MGFKPTKAGGAPSTQVPRLAGHRIDDRGGDDAPGTDQPDRDRDLGRAGDQLLGAVDRVDDPDELATQSGAIVDGFLGEPAAAGEQRDELAFQERIDDGIDGGHRRSVRLRR